MIVVIIGGTKGIGGCAADVLRAQGHEVCTVARSSGDIRADIGTPEGRRAVIEGVRARCGFRGYEIGKKYAEAFEILRIEMSFDEGCRL